MRPRVFLFPLQNSMTLSKVTLPYHIFEPRYRQMIRDSIELSVPVAVLPHNVGEYYVDEICYAGIPQILHQHDDGRMDIAITGETRCHLERSIRNEPYLVYDFRPEEEVKRFSTHSDFGRECLKDALQNWARRALLQNDQLVAFERTLQDPEALLNFSTLFLLNNMRDRRIVVREMDWDKKVEILLKALGPKEISLGPFLKKLKLN